jgi:enoyl-CoA hydratase/carnithine racemase
MKRYETIAYETFDKIARITLNRPETRNAINTRMIEEYVAALDAANGDPGVVVIIVTGAGTAFSAGMDLKEAQDFGPREQQAYLDRLYSRMHHKILALTKPIIAQMNGPAREAGCTIAFACDMIVAADTASIGYPGIAVGIPPGAHIWHAQRIAGRMKAAQMIFTAEPISAVEAERMGLLTKVVPAATLEEETLRLASRIASLSPAILAITRELFYRVENMDYWTAIKTIADGVSLSFDTMDSKEGRRAFVEKRQPVWQGK